MYHFEFTLGLLGKQKSVSRELLSQKNIVGEQVEGAGAVVVVLVVVGQSDSL